MTTSPSPPNGYVLLYGSNGAVGKDLATKFKTHNWWVGCINNWKGKMTKEKMYEGQTRSTHSFTDPEDKRYRNEDINKEGSLNILVDANKNMVEQEEDILDIIKGVLGRKKKLDAIICLASGFTNGNANEELTTQADIMWKQNVWPAIISSSIAVAHLKEGGFLCLPGEKTALNPTPTTVAYGLAKAAIHHLTKSLATKESALPKNSTCVGLLPVTIDNIVNAGEAKPETDVAGWTPTKHISKLLFDWTTGTERPDNGSFVLFNTKNFSNEVTFIK